MVSGINWKLNSMRLFCFPVYIARVGAVWSKMRLWMTEYTKQFCFEMSFLFPKKSTLNFKEAL